MRADPLSFFALDKLGAVGADNATDARLDPGERALAGLAAQGSMYAVALPWAGAEVLRHLSTKDAVAWGKVDPLMGVRHLADAASAAAPSPARVLGLFDVAGRAKNAPGDNWQRVVGKLDEIHGVVDAFFDKHHLGEKGVTLNFRSGPLSSAMGPHFDTATKKVFTPQLSKEIVLHELGHAADYLGGRVGRVRAIAEPILQRAAIASVPVALIAGDEIARAIPGTVDDKVIRFMQDHAPTIVGATLAATTLFPEAKASILALQHIKAVEGTEAALQAAKRLVPAWGTYALGMIPPVVGMALARRYMQKARAHHEKSASIARAAVDELKDLGLDLVHVGRQLGHGTAALVRDPDVGARILGAAKEVGTSPSFVIGALSAAVPATAGALYLYGTKPGEVLREQIVRVGRSPREIVHQRPHDERWRQEHPASFAGVVGLGTALSAGILTKLITDMKEVL